MKEFSEGYQDYGGLLLIFSATVCIGVLAQYLFWTTRVIYYNVDLGVSISQPEELRRWVLQDTLFSEILWMGYLIFRNFLFCYIGAWILKGNRDAKGLFMGLGYSLSPQALCRIVQLILSITAFPEIKLLVSSDISMIAITTSLQRILYYPERLRALKTQRDEAWAKWMEEPAPYAYRVLFQIVNLWTTALACLLFYYTSRLPRKTVLLLSSVLIALEIFLYYYGYLL
jgi:hypothetical protein